MNQEPIPKPNLDLHQHLNQGKLLQRADVVWSRMELKDDEVLLVKVATAAAGGVGEIAEIIDKAFGSRSHQVLVYVDGTLEITKVIK